MKITENIHYVGVNDRRSALFERLWPLPYGVTYNSYLIDDEKSVLFDTVESTFFPRLLKNITEVLGNRQLNYLVINHMEPDHSESIALLRRYYPQMTIVGNKKTLEMIQGYYSVCDNTLCVADGEELPLGRHTLSFHLTPMVHWPETMMSYEKSSHTLFSGDAFGCFGALNGAIIDKDMETALYMQEMVRYYACIVGKYGQPVQKALQKLKPLTIERLCPTHGPVWEQQIGEVLAEYNRMSLYQAERGVVIAYGSMYGHTEEMAEAVAAELAAQGIKKIVLHNLSQSDSSFVLADLFRYRALIVGCPTYNGGLFPPMEQLLSKIASRNVTGRLLGCFGSFTWAGAINKEMTAWSEKLKFECVNPPIENKQGVTADTLAACRALGKAMADKLKEA